VRYQIFYIALHYKFNAGDATVTLCCVMLDFQPEMLFLTFKNGTFCQILDTTISILSTFGLFYG